MTVTIPETEPQIKTPTSNSLGNVVEIEPSSDRVAIVIQISTHGHCSTQIHGSHSDECDRLSERLEVAQPVLESLQKIFMTQLRREAAR